VVRAPVHPYDRWADAGKVTGAVNGIEHADGRTLGVPDRKAV